MALYTSIDPRTAKQEIWGMLHPYSNLAYPVAYSSNGKGGHRSVSSITSTVPPVSHRVEGMTVHQLSNKTTYKLGANLTSWTAEPVATGGSNGLYTRIVHPAGAHGEVQTTEEWNDGKLEIFIKFPTQITSYPSGVLFYWQSNLITFKIRFNETPTVVGGVLDTRGGVAWNSMASLSSTAFRGVICGSANTAGGELTLHAVGAWK